MRFRTLLAFPLLVASLTAAPEERGQLDASPTLFSVMAAINAAGYDAEADSAANHPLRTQLRQHLAGRKIECLDDLRKFVREHQKHTRDGKTDWNAELNQYVSYALSVEAPTFESRFKPNEIPPDVQELQGFQALMIRFYRDADIEALWPRARAAYQEMIERYQPPVIQSLLEMNGYLRNPTSGYLGRRFQIYVEPLMAAGQFQTRSYGDDYFVVIGSSQELQIDPIRHAYLHYVLDPLATKYGEKVARLAPLIDYAKGVPYLDESYKSDFLLLTIESLIKAVESRLMRGDELKKQTAASESLRQGYVLTAYFSEQLPRYEKQPTAMRLYFPEMLDALDMKKEAKRLDTVKFSQEPPAVKSRTVTASAGAPSRPSTAADQLLEQAEDLYAKKDLDLARQSYLKLLQSTDRKPLHAQAYYGLARIATLKNDPELAEKLFQKTIETGPDEPTKAWALVYLGRLTSTMTEEGREQRAAEFFRQALAVPGISQKAREAAQAGLQRANQKTPPNP